MNEKVYIILGIDDEACDQVIAVCRDYDEAKVYCTRYLMETKYHDVWIEKHGIL